MFANFVESGAAPVFTGARARNTMLDWFFYDVENLSLAERSQLIAERNREGAILVVWPRGERGDLSITKFADYEGLRAAPGRMLQRFSIAGVGSSDVGAAAFARALADHYGEPVGAIVAGYGVADLLSEAMGGWFVLGGANRVMQMYHDALDRAGAAEAGDGPGPDLPDGLEAAATSAPRRRALERVDHRTDSATLTALLMDHDRQVISVAGHSKGCLSIAYALEALCLSGPAETVARQCGMRITTVGAVTAMPRAFANVGQYLGELDWFGGMNSRRALGYTTIPGAWHHLNTRLPGHLDLAEVLALEPA